MGLPSGEDTGTPAPVASSAMADQLVEDTTTPAQAMSALVADQSLDAQWMAAMEMFLTLDEQEWAIFKKLTELDPAQWERLQWLLEQDVDSWGSDPPTADGTITDYDIELLSFIVPDVPLLKGSPDIFSDIANVLNWVKDVYYFVTEDIPEILEDLWDDVEESGT